MMFLPVLSLSSLASRVVLSEDLDTRELPLHLHRELEDYRRLEGAFTLLQVDFEVERIDGGEVSEEDREVAKQFFLETTTGQLILSCDVYVDYENNKWSMRNSDEHRSASVHMQSPVDLVHDNIVLQNNYKRRCKATYLESGTLMMLESSTLLGVNNGQDQLTGLLKESYRVDPADQLTWVQEFHKQEAGLVFTFTNRGTRAQRWGDTQAFCGSDEDWKLAQKAKGAAQIAGTGTCARRTKDSL